MGGGYSEMLLKRAWEYLDEGQSRAIMLRMIDRKILAYESEVPLMRQKVETLQVTSDRIESGCNGACRTAGPSGRRARQDFHASSSGANAPPPRSRGRPPGQGPASAPRSRSHPPAVRVGAETCTTTALSEGSRPRRYERATAITSIVSF